VGARQGRRLRRARPGKCRFPVTARAL